MTKPAKITVAVLLVAVFTALALWFTTQFERVPVTVKTDYHGAARSNPYLAARRLLHKLDPETRFMHYRRDLPPTNGTLVLLGSPGTYSPESIHEIFNWVRRGGHLVVIADELQDHPLVEHWSIVANPESSDNSRTHDVVWRTNEKLAVEFTTSTTYARTDIAPIINVGARLLMFSLADGYVTLLGDAALISNAAIGTRDHAILLWRLTHFERSGPVWIVTGGDRSPWSELLLRLWPLCVPLLLGALALLWVRARRFGPAIPPAAGRDPELMDHITASGEFLWSGGARGNLLDSVRNALVETIQRRHPGWQHNAGQYVRIASLSKVSPEQVEQAFAEQAALGRENFTAAVVALETIRRRL